MAVRILLDTLRDRIADAIAGAVKAYDVPKVCAQLGLSDGNEDEAFRSKRLYVKSRLRDIREEARLLRIATDITSQFDVPGLADVVSELTTHADHRVTQLTRRAVLKAMNPLDPLFGELDFFNGLEVIAPPWHRASEFGRAFDTLRDDVQQHYLRNPDWSNFELLEKCGALECVQGRFFSLIEKVLDPIARSKEEQTELAATLDRLLKADGFGVVVVNQISGRAVYSVRRRSAGVAGAPKNLIFASIGEKPELVFRDAINNDVEIRTHADKCLIYDRPLSSGLKWITMASWWQEREGIADLQAARKSLGERLMRSVELTGSPGEYAIFRNYYEVFTAMLGDELPALIPQVYLHYDPLTVRQRGTEKALERQRMDFLMLFDANVRIVIEVDGKRHYADGDIASPTLYASLVAEDRRLRLAGYELYRFGAAEFQDVTRDGGRYFVGPSTKALVTQFFETLFKRHGLIKEGS